MFDKIYGMLRKAAADALPVGVFATVMYDALENDATPSPTNQRVANITTEMGDSRQQSLGSKPRFQVEGNIVITIYEASGAGDGNQLVTATAISDALRNKKIVADDVTAWLYSPTPVNGVRTGTYWSRVIRCPFKVHYYPQLSA